MLSFIECSFYLISLFVLGYQLPSRVRLFVPLWTAAPQAPLCMGFSRQEYWSGWPCPSPFISGSVCVSMLLSPFVSPAISRHSSALLPLGNP